MIIESKIKRDPPTEVTLGDTAYKFAPDEQGRHVCEVKDKEHAARLLSITEGFCVPGDKPVPAAMRKEIERQVETLKPVDTPSVEDTAHKLSPSFAATIDLTDNVKVEQLEVIQRSCDEVGMTVFDWNSLTDEARDNLIEIMLNVMLEEVEPGSTETPDDTTSDTATGASTEPGQSADTTGQPEELTEEQKAAELEGLRAEYFAKFQKKPNARAGAARLRELLAAESASDEEEGE